MTHANKSVIFCDFVFFLLLYLTAFLLSRVRGGTCHISDCKNTKNDIRDVCHFLYSSDETEGYGATRLMSRGNIEHSLTLAMPRKHAVIRSKPMAKPP